MPTITYHVVVPFDRDEDGMIVPGKAKEAPNAEAARRRAQALGRDPAPRRCAGVPPDWRS